MNQTPLMAAAAAGNVALAEALLERGADPENTDQYGYNALHHAMRAAFNDPKYAQGSFSTLYELLAPPHLDVNPGGRLVRIDRHMSEYFLFQTLWVLFKSRFAYLERGPYAAFETWAILKAWKHLPANVVYPERNKRSHISALLARNELDRDYTYNRALFKRIKQGWYQFNPQMLVRSGSGRKDWQPVFAALNLPLINEFSRFQLFNDLAHWDPIGEYCERANMPPPTIPIAAEREIEQRRKTLLETK
jgi:hypothetical protein